MYFIVGVMLISAKGLCTQTSSVTVAEGLFLDVGEDINLTWKADSRRQ